MEVGATVPEGAAAGGAADAGAGAEAEAGGGAVAGGVGVSGLDLVDERLAMLPGAEWRRRSSSVTSSYQSRPLADAPFSSSESPMTLASLSLSPLGDGESW